MVVGEINIGRTLADQPRGWVLDIGFSSHAVTTYYLCQVFWIEKQGSGFNAEE